jgi:hypothetical protein
MGEIQPCQRLFFCGSKTKNEHFCMFKWLEKESKAKSHDVKTT